MSRPQFTRDLFTPAPAALKRRADDRPPDIPAEGHIQLADEAHFRAYIAAHQARRQWFEVRHVAALDSGVRRRYLDGCALKRPAHTMDRLRADLSDFLNGR